MKHTRYASYVPSSYTKNSPTMRPQSGVTKKTPTNNEATKATRLVQADMNIKVQPVQNIPDHSEKKASSIAFDRTNEFTASLYHLSKVLEKDQQTYSQLYKTKEVQQKKVQKNISSSRPVDSNNPNKVNDKLSIYQYVQSKSKKAEDYKSALNVSNQASSRASSRIVIYEDNNDSLINRVNDPNALSSKRFLGSASELSQSKSKSKLTPTHQKNLSTTSIKSTQKTPINNAPRQINLGQHGSVNNLSFNEACHDLSKTPEAKKQEVEKISSIGNNFNEALANKLKIALQGLQGDLQNARHRRGLSSGQVPIFMEQQMMQIQEKIKPIELPPPQDPQQEQDEFFEKFFHSDKMTFEFEKLIVSQRNKPQNGSFTVAPTPTNMKPTTAHARTRSIEDPNCLLPTKATSRWNTKRSSVGDELQFPGKATPTLSEQVNEMERVEYEKEERRRYLRG